jgi:hypothetical protein
MRETAAPLDEAALQHLSPQERLKKFIFALMTQLLDHESASPMAQIMLWEAIDPTAMFDSLVKQVPGRQLALLDDIVSSWIGSSIKKKQVRAASISILGQCVYYRYGSQILAKTEGHVASKREIRDIADHIFTFSSAALDGLKRVPQARTKRLVR